MELGCWLRLAAAHKLAAQRLGLSLCFGTVKTLF